ncbi:MAG: peptide chain release factor N(5)-glutamine methyltransferase [Sarcina sp.]
MKECKVGGQAVLDGVMIRGKKGKATAIRNNKGNIEVDVERFYEKEEKLIDKIPIIRGILSLGNSLDSGMESFNYSLGFANDESNKLIDKVKEKLGNKSDEIIKKFTLYFSLFLSIIIFIVFPSLISGLFRPVIENKYLLTVLEGIITLIILILYLEVIKTNDMVKNLFRYHGAEHKTINCYEKMEELTIENVKKASRLHKRCGTNFLFNVIIINTFLDLFLGWQNLILRIILRIVILPITIGITYELIKWLGESDNKLTSVVAFLGVKLQLLTTKEPSKKEIEVAIMALKASEGLKFEKTVEELLNDATKVLRAEKIDSARLDAQLLLAYLLKKEKLWLITNSDYRLTEKEEKEFLSLIEKRKNKMPIKYILGKAEFMGLDFFVKEGVLIPRPDTEILVEEILKNIDEDEKLNLCDLCCGSGAIGLSLASFRKNIKVDLVDIDDIPKEVTLKNIENLNLKERANFIQSDLFNNLNGKKYSIIASNPPYIKEEVIDTLMEDVKNYEPHLALAGGVDGLVFYKKIILESDKYLNEKGILAFEIGHDQGEAVRELMEKKGFSDLRVLKDLAGLDRVVTGKLNS